jgi:hypothetical protein
MFSQHNEYVNSIKYIINVFKFELNDEQVLTVGVVE